MSSTGEVRPMIANGFQGTQGTLVPTSAEKKQELTKELAAGITPAFERYFATLEQIAEIEQENISLSRQEDELTQHIEELTQRNKARQNEIKEYESHIQECESRIEERERHISELREQNLMLQRQRDEQVLRRATMIQKAEENRRLLAEKQALRDALKVEAAKHSAVADRLEASVAQRKENIGKRQASVAEQRQVIAQSRASTADKFKPLLCKYFNQAFYGKDATISGAPADELYSQYLSNREITVGKDSAGKACIQVNDPAPFKSFSQNHPEITSCNLSAFIFIAAHAQPLIDYLSSKDCPLKVVTFSNKMSQTLQQLFKQASLDNGSLTINFNVASSSKTVSSSS